MSKFFNEIYEKAYAEAKDPERKLMMKSPETIKAVLTAMITMDSRVLDYIWGDSSVILSAMKPSDVTASAKALITFMKEVDLEFADLAPNVPPSTTIDFYNIKLPDGTIGILDKDGNIREDYKFSINDYREAVCAAALEENKRFEKEHGIEVDEGADDEFREKHGLKPLTGNDETPVDN